MSRDPLLFVADILESCAKVRDYTQGMDLEQFSHDSKTFDAVARNLEIIGEAAKMIPAPIKDECSHVDWKGMIGLRTILAHGYFGVHPSILWSIVTEKIDELEEALRPYID